ncbi:methionine ABC transporter permease [Lachnospiraceae bacterium oral taxon 500]|nr:methionine ABC transporter permease [Lachnospiraceae bacterium oral taxon 500]
MNETLNSLIIPGFMETLYMVFFSTVFAVLLGLPIGVLLLITEENHILPMKSLNLVLSSLVNIFRSLPFIILIIILFPLSRLIVDTAIGSTAAIVPLSIAAAPFVARVAESALREVPWGMIEAAKSMGANNWQIIWRVLLPESVSALVLGLTLTVINILGYTAMAGAVGAGGIGDVAIRYGYQRFRDDVLWITVIVLILMVQAIQSLGNFIAGKLDKRKG